MPTPILIVLDTNVLVSGLLKRNSPPGKVLDMILAGMVQVAMDERIYDEYTRVLARPRLRIPPNQARDFLAFFSVAGRRISGPFPDPAEREWPDPKDIPFAQVAIMAQVQTLVTGNTKHFHLLANYGIRVLSPAEFIAQVISS